MKSVNTSLILILLLVVSLEKHIKLCKKHYTGQTTGNFRGRWSNSKSKSKSFKRGEKCNQEHLYKHFENEGHTEFLDDVSITLIDKTDGSNPTKRENCWMRTIETYTPYGLNVVDTI